MRILSVSLAVTLLAPGIAAIVIAALFPEAAAILGDKLDPPDPFRALPEIELGDHRAHRPAMLARQRFALPGMREQRIIIVEIRQGKIRGVVVVAVKHDEARLGQRPRQRENMLGAHPVPLIVEARPCSDAVYVGDIAELRLGAELVPAPIDAPLDQTVDREPPLRRFDPRNDA